MSRLMAMIRPVTVRAVCLVFSGVMGVLGVSVPVVAATMAAPAIVMDSGATDSHEMARQWLQRMATSLTETHFQFSMMQMQRDQSQPLRYTHGVVDGQQVALLETLNGPLSSVVRVGSTVVFLEYGNQPYSVASDRIPDLWPGAFAGNLGVFDNHYQFVLAGRNRIAGRPVQIVRVMALDAYRYQYQLWLDQESALPLRMDLLDANNNLLEKLLVIESHLFAEPLPILSELQAQQWPSILVPPANNVNERWRFGWLPEGFVLRHYDKHRLLGLNEPIEYLSLTDGLSDFSVYIGRAGRVTLPKNIVAGNGLGLASAIHGDFEVVVVGKMPAEALTNVAENLYPANTSKPNTPKQ